MFQFIPNVLDEVKVRALCRPVKFPHTKLGKAFLYAAGFVNVEQSCVYSFLFSKDDVKLMRGGPQTCLSGPIQGFEQSHSRSLNVEVLDKPQHQNQLGAERPLTFGQMCTNPSSVIEQIFCGTSH